MSCFVLPKAHIDFLVHAADVLTRDRTIAGFNVLTEKSSIGQALINANNESVSDCYGEKAVSELVTEPYKFDPKGMSERLPRMGYTGPQLAQVIMACNSYEYQSSEGKDWRLSNAKRLVTQIRESAIANLPGMSAADWVIIRDQVVGAA